MRAAASEAEVDVDVASITDERNDQISPRLGSVGVCWAGWSLLWSSDTSFGTSATGDSAS